MTIFYTSASTVGGGTFNVKNYGAVGDRVTDDTAAIQAALDAAQDGGIVFFPVGEYMITGTLMVEGSPVMRGEGRARESDPRTVGSILVWSGGVPDTMMRINPGLGGKTTHGWVLEDIGFDGGDSGVKGTVLGGASGSPKAAVGSLNRVWYDGCGVGVESNNAQLVEMNSVHANDCSIGFSWIHGSGHGNTTNYVTDCRASRCGIGFRVYQLTGSTFKRCTAELCDYQGWYYETGTVSPTGTQGVYAITMDDCWTEGNMQLGGTGMGDIETYSWGTAYHSEIQVNNHHFGSTPAGNYRMLLRGTFCTIHYPRLVPLGTNSIHLEGSGATTVVHATVLDNPETVFGYTLAPNASMAHIERNDTNTLGPKKGIYVMRNHEPRKVQEWDKTNGFIIGDRWTDNVNKIARLGSPHYDIDEEYVVLVQSLSQNGENLLNVGGGTAAMNAQNTVNIWAATGTADLIGTKIVEVDVNGLEVLQGDLDAERVRINHLARLYSASGFPVSGGYNRGDIVFNHAPTGISAPAAWVCTTGGVPGQWRAWGEIEPRQPIRVNVRDYGATGDGVNNDWQAIRDAIIATPLGGTCYIPAGTYVVSGTIDVLKNINLVGDGRGQSGALEGGSLIKWSGATDEHIIRVNNGSRAGGATAVEGFTIRDLGVTGNGVSGVRGITLGAGNEGTPPREAIGTLENLWIYDCATAVECQNLKKSRITSLDINSCNIGVHFPQSTNFANETVSVDSLSIVSGGVGIHIDNLVGGNFNNIVAENNSQEAVLIEPGATWVVEGITFHNLKAHNNWSGNQPASGTGAAQIRVTSSGTTNPILCSFDHPHITSTASGDVDMRLSGGNITVLYPELHRGAEIADNDSVATYVSVETFDDPLGSLPWTVVGGGTSSVFATVRYISKGGGSTPQIETYIASSEAKGLAQVHSARQGYLFLSDSGGHLNSTNKSTRIVVPHYSSSEEPFGAIFAQTYSGQNRIHVGGGTSVGNAATRVSLYAAANSSTTTGTEMVRVDSGDVDIVNGNLRFETSSTRMTIGSGAPTAGSYNQGHIVINTAPSAGGYMGWVCVAGGTPGTWKGWGTIEA